MVILFDGICNLCNGFVNYVLKHDKNKVFQFASLQSKYGKELSSHFKVPERKFMGKQETIILYDGKKILTESDAVIKIAHTLKGIWSAAAVFNLVPRFIRNWFYRFVARNRYRIFGKKEQCMVPSEGIKDRFLDNTNFAP